MPKRWICETPLVRVMRLVVGSFDNNVYIVADRSSNAAVIVDAAAEADTIVDAAAEFEVTAVLTTHGHRDHVGAVAEVCDRLSIPFRLHKADDALAGMTSPEPLTDGLIVGPGGLTVRHTPGHTPGSVTFAVPGLLLTGDTLFPGGPGATRFPYSNFDTIMASLDERLFVEDDTTIVLPGHGESTTVGTERPFLEEWRARRW
ncbi:MAG: MBL fold metallo-hydrolase [Acidimicrobiia bacterium]|nr:MBL fold metallo-hydrolase [Acidimicrobiia bacterium]